MRLLNKFILLTVLGFGVLYAYTYQNGILSAGEELIIAPKDGYSFNVKKFSGSGANYDIQMSNKGNVYYSAEGQLDDIYLVFHDDVLPGDRIKIHVNSGRFEYSFSAVNRLPTIVKKALIKKAVKVEVEEKSYKQTNYKKRYKRYKSKKVKKDEPIVGEFVTENEFKNKKQIVDETINDEEFKKELEQKQEQFDSTNNSDYTQIDTTNSSTLNEKPFSDSFYDKFTAIFQDLVKKFANENESAKQSPKVTNKNKIQIDKNEKKEESFKVDKRELVHEATIIRSNFDKLPTEIDLFDVEDKKDTPVKKEPNPNPKVVEKSNKVVQKETKPIKTNESSINSNSVNDKFIGRVIGYKVADQGNVIDTGYKKGFEDLESKNSNENEEIKSSVEARKNGDKIVITKILEKEKKQENEDKFAGRVLGKSSDRVLGGAYDPSKESASFGVRATKNSLPVSAWIEVFKNGTKSRVKTFYTSIRKLKKIKLPAGVYMIRATYRTRDGKLQKTLKNIHIKNGEDITKHVTFNEGRLKVVAKKGGKAQYVKVVVYKSGSKGRYTYEFSDRDTGVAIITLPVGVYDIEVINHDQKREFRSERIKASNTDTIVAEF